MEGLIFGILRYVVPFFYLPKVSRDFDVQIVISWSLWSGFLRATLFGNSEFFIFVLAFFFFFADCFFLITYCSYCVYL